LRAENRRLQKENEILKKTAIYFAKESKWGSPLLPNIAINTLQFAFAWWWKSLDEDITIGRIGLTHNER
jgi:hypothetical protein